MFPFDLDEDDEIELAADTDADEAVEEYPEYEIDFETMTLTGRMISGIDAIKQWVRICLGIERYNFTQYSWEYGQDFESLLGKVYTEKELKPILQRMISEALSIHKDIDGISDLSVAIDGDKTTASFRINTVYGTDMLDVPIGG